MSHLESEGFLMFSNVQNFSDRHFFFFGGTLDPEGPFGSKGFTIKPTRLIKPTQQASEQSTRALRY